MRREAERTSPSQIFFIIESIIVYKGRLLRFYICFNPFHNGIKRGAGSENRFDAGIVKYRYILFRNNTAADDSDIGSVFFAQKFHDTREKHAVSTGKTAQTNHINIFLNSGRHNLFRCLMTARVNHFKSGIAETTRENAGAAIVAIKPRFGNHHANFSFLHIYLLKYYDKIIYTRLISRDNSAARRMLGMRITNMFRKPTTLPTKLAKESC